MELPRQQVLDQCESAEGPRIELLQKFADEFEITFDDLIDGKFDNDWIANPTLNEKFQAEGGSKLRTSLPVIRWLEANYGESAANSLLRSLRIPRSAVSNPDHPVKLRLLYQLIQAARARGVSQEGIFEMGRSAFALPENQSIRDTFGALRNPRDIFDCFFNEMLSKFEQNYVYRIDRVRDNSLTVAVTPREGRIQENGETVIFDRDVSIYRWGVAASTVGVSRFELSRVSPVSEFSRENPVEYFKIQWRPGLQAATESTAPSKSNLRLL